MVFRICTELANPNGTDGKGLSKEKMAKYKKEQEDADAKVMESSHASQFKVPTRLGAISSRPPLPREINTPSKRSNLAPLEKSFNNVARGIADEAICRCIYANGLPFNLV